MPDKLARTQVNVVDKRLIRRMNAAIRRLGLRTKTTAFAATLIERGLAVYEQGPAAALAGQASRQGDAAASPAATEAGRSDKAKGARP